MEEVHRVLNTDDGWTGAVDADGFYRASPVEMAAGWVPGRLTPLPPLAPARGEHPVQALEQVLLPALEQRPCVVGFSGGRDSSVVLAVAARVAAREGLDPPVPVTKVYPGHAETDETAWQELVVRHLGVSDWIRQEFEDELDLLGPAAQASLRALGPLWPATCHNRAPHLAVAAGGSYLGGEGGDEMLGEFRATPFVRLHGTQVRPSVSRAVKESIKVFGPRPVRRAVLDRALGERPLRPWLRPELERWYRRTVLDDESSRPLGYAAALRHFLGRRAIRAALRNLHTVGRHLDVTYVQPLVDPRFATALAAHGGRYGYRDRTTAMRALFGDLLPDALLARATKASFNGVYAHRHTRAFIDRWDGSGLDDELVDVEALHRLWREPVVHGGTFQLLQLAWLRSTPADDRSGG